MKVLAIGVALALSVGTAAAKDSAACGAGMVCASDPATIVSALQQAGYKAKLEKDTQGDPLVSSSASGYNFDVLFYGCEKAAQCDSVQFSASFVAEKENTPAYANAWNIKKRFIQASVNDKSELFLRYDITTLGGMNKTNFADALDWWTTMLGEFATFVDQQKKAAK